MQQLNEPSPYDHIQNINGHMVPDLLVFSKPLLNMGMNEMSFNLDQRIASDSCMADSGQSLSNDLSNDVLSTMTQAMNNLTTSTDKDSSRKQIRDSLIDITNEEGNK